MLAICMLLVGLTATGLGAGTPTSSAATPSTFDQPDGGIVTVSQTDDLIYQSIDISWSGFRPTQVVDPNFPLFDPNRVWLMQCRGADPTRQDCLFGGSQFTQGVRSDGQGNFIPFLDQAGQPTVVNELGTSNELFATTDADGTGRVQFEVRTKAVFPVLGCEAAADPAGAAVPTCSVVIVPSYDANNTEPLTDANWAHRVAVPLSFAPAAEACDIRNPDAIFEGAATVQRLFESWQGKLCSQADRVDAVYVSGGEAGARTSFGAGIADAALTIRPFEEAPPRPAVYAPFAVSGIGIGFLVDDQFTGRPLGALKLNARVVAKVITQSYGVTTDNPATTGNPLNFGSDPELLALNPDLSEGTVLSLQTPIMLSGDSDLVYELTRWVDSDPAARAFLDGEVDPYGMHVSSFYRGVDLPVSQLELRDNLTAVNGTCAYLPVQDMYPLASLSQAARAVVTASTLGRLPPIINETGNCAQSRVTEGFPGQRGALALLDTAAAAALRVPMAELRNSKGGFIGPDRLSMSAALRTMTVNPDGVTRQVDHTSLPENGYPLTTLTTAVVPTSGLATELDGQAERIARVLDLAATTGQLYGVLPGDLPDGYVSLPEDMRAQTAAAAQAVRAQSGAPATPAGTPTPVASPTSAAAPSAAGALGGSPPSGAGPPPGGDSAAAPTAAEAAAAAEALAPDEGPTLGAEPAAQQRGARTLASALRWVLPALILVALLAGVIGPALLQLGKPGSQTNRALAAVRRRLTRSSPT